jgi:hypothetical protein
MKMQVSIIIPSNTAAIEEGDFHAGIKIYGIEYACSFVAGRYQVLNVSGVRYNSSRAKWQIANNSKIARQWLVSQIESLGPEFMERHNSLYSEEMAA